MASESVITQARAALDRLKAAVKDAQAVADANSHWYTSQSTIDSYNARVFALQSGANDMEASINRNDPDDKLIAYMDLASKFCDISDLIAAAKANSLQAIVPNPAQVLGTAVDLTGKGVGAVGGAVLKNLPWWAYAIGIVALLITLGPAINGLAILKPGKK